MQLGDGIQSLKGCELAQPVELRLAELLDRLSAVGAAEHRADHQQQDFRQWIQLVALEAKVRKRGKMLKNAG
jgi:hypothetical protein